MKLLSTLSWYQRLASSRNVSGTTTLAPETTPCFDHRGESSSPADDTDHSTALHGRNVLSSKHPTCSAKDRDDVTVLLTSVASSTWYRETHP